MCASVTRPSGPCSTCRMRANCQVASFPVSSAIPVASRSIPTKRCAAGGLKRRWLRLTRPLQQGRAPVRERLRTRHPASPESGPRCIRSTHVTANVESRRPAIADGEERQVALQIRRRGGPRQRATRDPDQQRRTPDHDQKRRPGATALHGTPRPLHFG